MSIRPKNDRMALLPNGSIYFKIDRVSEVKPRRKIGHFEGRDAIGYFLSRETDKSRRKNSTA